MRIYEDTQYVQEWRAISMWAASFPPGIAGVEVIPIALALELVHYYAV